MRLALPDSRSLKARLLTWLLVALALLLAPMSYLAYQDALTAANTAYDRSLLTVAKVIAERVDLRERQVVVEVPYVALDFFEADLRGRVYYRVSGLQGEFVSGFTDLPPLPTGVPRSDDYYSLAHFYDSTYRGEAVRVVALLQPVFNAQARGMALVQVAETANSRELVSRRLLRHTVMRELLLVALAGVVILLVVRAALRPMQRLHDDLATREANDLSALPAEAVPAEVRPIVQGMNGYMQRLRELLVARERFVADASHQLRTPLTLLKTQTELALREADADRLRETLKAIDRSVSDTVRLANELLGRARVHNDLANPRVEGVDLVGPAREACLELAPLAVAKGVDLALRNEGAVPLRGDALLLREMARNLVDNAIRYTPPGGHVSVEVAVAGDRAMLTVEDSGIGIAPADRERVFDPFFRASSTERGVGLGLTIARDIARAHHGVIDLGDAVGGTGLRVRAVLPADAGGPAAPSPAAAG